MKAAQLLGKPVPVPVKVFGSPDSREKRLQRRGILKEQQEIQDLIQNNEELRSPAIEYELDRNMSKSKTRKIKPVDESPKEELNSEKSDEQMGRKKLLEEKRIMSQLLKEKEDFCRKKELRDAVLLAIEKRIAPGSLVVANDKALPDICSLLHATGKYEAVMSLPHLLEADDKGQIPVESILGK